MDDIMTMAAELGEAIAGSKEMTRLKNAETELESDGRATALMKDYKTFQIELVKATRDKKDKAVVDEIKSRLLSVQKELNEYKVTNDYLTAKSDFDRLVKTVNDVMTFKITGEIPCSSGGCGSCSGCK